jgi:Kef-type K+ transport system membrane component KefB
VQLKEIIAFVFLDVAIVIVAARLMGRLFQRLGQPAVIGEILAGIMLGPTLLGLLPGDLHLVLFPTDVRPYLTVIAQLGLVLFMFIVGLEVDLSLIRSRRRTATSVSMASIALPFALGALLASALQEDHGVVDGAAVPFLAFALFLGVAMSITAFPVLARILTERGMHRTPTGVLSLACAAIDDVLAWSLLAIVIAVAVGGTLTGVALIVGLTAVYALVMFGVVRPLLARLVGRYRAAGRLTPNVLATVLVGVFLSAYATELIGVHAIFGAFVFGAVMPRGEPGLTREVLERLEQVSLLLLLPVFFVVAGLQVDVGALGASGLVELVLILLVAIGGKFVGAFAAARLQRVPQRQAVALGVLMNTRGLTEIVILQVGVQLGVLDPQLFTLMVIMALVTTLMTSPLLRLFYPDRIVQREIAAAERAELGEEDAFTVLVAVPDGAAWSESEELAVLARDLLGREHPARVVLARLLPRPAVPLEIASGLGTDLATITAAGDDLRRLARRLEATGATCSVVARFSADPTADLAALAASVQADVVLMSQPDEEPAPAEQPAKGSRSRAATLAPPAAALPEVGEAALAVVRPRQQAAVPPPGPVRVAVLTDGGAGGRSALRLGAHVALHRGVAVGIGGTDERRTGRRAAAAVQVLRRHGVDAHDLPDEIVADVLLLPEGARAPRVGEGTTVAWVRPAAADADEDLGQVVARVALGT